MTKYLPSLIDDDDLGYDIILSIISRIKKQLSNYAVEKLDLELDNNVNASFYQENEEFLNKKNNLILYALKSGETFEFLINDVMVKGVLKYNNDGKYIILGNGITTKIDDFKEIKFLKKA